MFDNEWDFVGDGNEADEESAQKSFKPPQLLVGIDTHNSMFTKFGEGLHAFHCCLFGIYTVLDQLLLRSDQKSIAVILAHDCEEKTMLFDFDTPFTEKIAIVKKLLDMDEDVLKNEYMRAGTFDFASFLLFAKKQFQKSTAEIRSRTFLYITNDSNPVGSDVKLKFRALNEAQNFPALKIGFELVTMSVAFTWDEFYEEMFKAMDLSLMKERCEDEDGIVEKMLLAMEPSVNFCSAKFFPALNNKKIFMKVFIDSIVHRPTVISNKKLTRDRHAEVRLKKQNESTETEKIATICKDVKLKLKNEEIETLRTSQYPVGYALLGVLKQPMSRPEIVIKKHDLMFQKPKEICNYFNVFWKYCSEKNRVLFCSYRRSKVCQAGFCEMLPEFLNNKPCFVIKYLYFLEDYVLNPELPFEDEEETIKEPSDAVINDISKLVDALTISYDPTAFTDVQSVREEAYIRSQVLEQPFESVENFLDDRSKINKVVDDLGVVQKRVADGKKSQQGNKRQRSGTKM